MNTEETKISSETLYDGKIMTVKRDRVCLPNGKTAAREFIEHVKGAAIVALLEGKIALVSQYRYALGKDVLELPAGKCENGESVELTAMRELKEETGLVSEKLTLIAKAYPSPGYTNEELYVYLAEDAKKGEQSLDEDEFLNVFYIEPGVLYSLIDECKICDAKTVIGVLRYKSLREAED